MRRFFTLLFLGVAAGALASCASVEDTMLAPLKYANGKQAPNTIAATRKPVLSSQEAAGPTAGPARKRVYRRKAPVSQPVQAAPKRERSGPSGGGGSGGGGGGGGDGDGGGPGGGGWG